jgi:hypothetical protein
MLVASIKGSDIIKDSRTDIRTVRRDPDERPNYRKLTDFGWFWTERSSIDLMADRLADGLTGLAA